MRGTSTAGMHLTHLISAEVSLDLAVFVDSGVDESLIDWALIKQRLVSQRLVLLPEYHHVR